MYTRKQFFTCSSYWYEEQLKNEGEQQAFFFLENDTAITDGRIQAADRPNTIPWFCYLLLLLLLPFSFSFTCDGFT